MRLSVSRPAYLVAVKTCHAEAGAAGRQALLEEATIMAQFQHPHVLSFIAIVLNDPLMVILEYAELGDLLGYLKKNAATMTGKLRARFAAECAEGLCFLHSRGFVHRDVAARNVLVSSGLQCKISDFGMSRDTENSEYYHSKGGDIAVRWSSPEVSACLVHIVPLAMQTRPLTTCTLFVGPREAQVQRGHGRVGLWHPCI